MIKLRLGLQKIQVGYYIEVNTALVSAIIQALKYKCCFYQMFIRKTHSPAK